MPDYVLTVTTLAQALGTSRQTINELLKGCRAVTPVMALKLGRLFNNTPEFWLNARHAVDLWEAEQRYKKDIERISPLHAA